MSNEGNKLSEMVGLRDRVSLINGNVLKLPYENETFEASYMVHVGMNISNNLRIYTEPINLLDEISEPDNITFIIELFCKWLFPVYTEITTSQKEDFKNIVIGNNPNMWKDEYSDYINDPTPSKKDAINKKLRDLLKEMFKSPEYHLS